jgi:hypothetical protein
MTPWRRRICRCCSPPCPRRRGWRQPSPLPCVFLQIWIEMVKRKRVVAFAYYFFISHLHTCRVFLTGILQFTDRGIHVYDDK